MAFWGVGGSSIGNPRASSAPLVPFCRLGHSPQHCSAREEVRLLTSAGRGHACDILVLHNLQCNSKESYSDLSSGLDFSNSMQNCDVGSFVGIPTNQHSSDVQEETWHFQSPRGLSVSPEPTEIFPRLRSTAKAGNLITGEGGGREMGSSR